MTNPILLGPVTGSAPSFGVVGVSYKTASLELRSALGIARDRVPEFLQRAKRGGLDECVLLSTCNRTEVYFSGADSTVALSILSAFTNVHLTELDGAAYAKVASVAAKHSFQVVAGLDSAVLGETDIVAQVREAWAMAMREGMVGPKLGLLYQRAIEASKRVRTETDLCKGVISSAVLAVREAKRLVDLKGKTVLVLGAGKFGHRIAKELQDVELGKAIVVNRTPLHAADVADILRAEVRSLHQLNTALVEADVVFAVATAEQALIPVEIQECVMGKRANRPLTILDLGLPANVEPGDSISGLTVIGLDQINKQSIVGSKMRLAAVRPAHEILEGELSRFEEAMNRRVEGRISLLKNRSEGNDNSICLHQSRFPARQLCAATGGE